jgi:hypothetical protein
MSIPRDRKAKTKVGTTTSVLRASYCLRLHLTNHRRSGLHCTITHASVRIRDRRTSVLPGPCDLGSGSLGGPPAGTGRASMLQLCHAFRVLGGISRVRARDVGDPFQCPRLSWASTSRSVGPSCSCIALCQRFTASAEWPRSRRQLITLLSWTQECIEAERCIRRLLFVVARAAATRLLHSRSFRSVAFCLEEAGMRQPCLKPLMVVR